MILSSLLIAVLKLIRASRLSKAYYIEIDWSKLILVGKNSSKSSISSSPFFISSLSVLESSFTNYLVITVFVSPEKLLITSKSSYFRITLSASEFSSSNFYVRLIIVVSFETTLSTSEKTFLSLDGTGGLFVLNENLRPYSAISVVPWTVGDING